jgi:hypothetical protein
VRVATDLADPEPIRKEIRTAVTAGDKPTLGRLAERLSAVDPDTAVALGDALRDKGMAGDAARVLRRVRDRHPSHLDVRRSLGHALSVAIPDDPVVAEEIAACLCARAFETDPRIAAGESFVINGNTHRYDAACDAALAGCGQGSDAPAAPVAQAELRTQALNWVRADLAMRAGQATSRNPGDQRMAALLLEAWLRDSDLAGLRPGPGFIDLPADERAAWDAFWADVRATLDRARKPTPARPVAPKPGTTAAPGG